MSLTFLAPQFLWALLALPVILALHFIRARRRRREVSAIFLWKEAKQVAEARRRFSPTWLLVLQLAFAALAALALAQPRLAVAGLPERVIIFDASASMAARDGDGVRIEKAKREALALLRGAGRVTLVRAGLDAVVVQPPSGERGALERAILGLSAVDREADLERAIALAQAVAPEAEVHLFTDEALPSSQRLQVHDVAGDGLNLGITTFDIGVQQAFISVSSSHPRPQEVELELLQEGAVVAASSLLVPAAGRASITFPLQQEGFFEARLRAPEWDALPLDNRAYAGARPLRVALLGAGEGALERALAAIPNLSVTRFAAGAEPGPDFDARVVVGAPPAALPPGKALYFAPPAEAPAYARIQDWDQSDPMLRFASLGGALVGLAPEPPPLPEGGTVLARTAELRPVLLRWQTLAGELVYADFNPAQTDLVNRSAFPLLIANVMASFRASARLPLGAPLPAGSSLVSGESLVSRASASEPGIYQVGGERYAVSLLSDAETRLPGAEARPASAEPETRAATSEQLWSAALLLVALALAALLAEWLLFSRARLPRLRLRRSR